jgi:hypothetical protein
MHTKEDWIVDKNRQGEIIILSALSEDLDVVIAELISPIESGFAGGLEEAAEIINANAKRIVACVNACKGIPTEELEKGIIEEMERVLGNWTSKSYGFDCQKEQMLETVDILNRLGNNG